MSEPNSKCDKSALLIVHQLEDSRNNHMMRMALSMSMEQQLRLIEEILDSCVEKNMWQYPVFLPNAVKNNEKSKITRKNGNQIFGRATNDGYLESLKWYNKSICFAENNSEELALAYGNRSIAFIKLKMYKVSLENIKLAKDAGFPNRLMSKLDARERHCLHMIATSPSKSPEVEVKLTVPANRRVPFMANCLEVRGNAQGDSKVITNRDLKVGDVVAIEPLFSFVLSPELCHQRCENCSRENCFSLIPCKGCTAVMFCNEKCAEEAQEKFHRFECSIIDHIRDILSLDQLVVLRNVIRAVTTFETVNKLFNFNLECNGQSATVFDCDYTNERRKALSTYHPIHSLYVGPIQSTLTDNVRAIIIARCLRNNPQIRRMFDTPEKWGFLKEIVFQHIRVVFTNRTTAPAKDLLNILGAGVYSTRCLFSHSCAPNVWNLISEGKAIMIILKPIKAGQQLVGNYGPLHHEKPIQQRHLELKGIFDCHCVACVMDYPLFKDLPTPKNVPESPDKEIKKILLDPRETKETKFSKTRNAFVQHLTKYAKQFPCQQLVLAETGFKNFLLGTTGEQVFMNMFSSQVRAEVDREVLS